MGLLPGPDGASQGVSTVGEAAVMISTTRGSGWRWQGWSARTGRLTPRATPLRCQRPMIGERSKHDPLRRIKQLTIDRV